MEDAAFQMKNSSVPYNIDIRTYRNIRFPYHYHGDYELLYTKKGEAEVFADGSRITLPAGKTALIPGGRVHGFSVSGESELWVGVFAADYVRDFPPLPAGRRIPLFAGEIRDRDRPFLEDRLFGNPAPDRLELCAALNLICAEYLRQAGPAKDAAADVPAARRIVGYVSTHFTEDITLSGAAAALNYEPHYLSRCFHRCFGRNFRDFLNEYRVSYARELLRRAAGEDGGKRILDIAYECGFQSARNFNRVYRSVTGLTPTEDMKRENEKRAAEAASARMKK